MRETNIDRLKRLCHQQTPRVSSELFCLTYGSFVQSLVKELKTVEAVNEKLYEVGTSIGSRMADELLAMSNIRNCKSFSTSVAIIAEIGFYMFLGITPSIEKSPLPEDPTVVDLKLNQVNPKGEMFTPENYILDIKDNPIESFVVLPDHLTGLSYSSMYCGILVGALAAVSIEAKATVVGDKLKGDAVTKILLEFKQVIDDSGTHEGYGE